jgi:hypothetical protein
MTVRVAVSEIQLLGNEALRCVVMRIHNNGTEMELSGALRDIVGSPGAHQREAAANKSENGK